MRLFVVADNLTGGGARLCERFLEELAASGLEMATTVIHRGNIKFPLSDRMEEQKLRPPWTLAFLAPFARGSFFRKSSGRVRVLNFTNFPLLLRASERARIDEFVLIHNPYLVAYPRYFAKSPGARFVLRDVVARRGLLRALTWFAGSRLAFVVQTDFMKSRTELRFPFVKVMKLPRHAGPGSVASPVLPQVDDRVSNWIYPAAFEPHKNHTALIGIARELRASGARLRIHITLKGERPGEKAFLDELERAGLGDIVVNRGWMPPEAIADCFAQGYGLAFFSSFESLGLPVIEAVTSRAPIVAYPFPTSMELAGNPMSGVEVGPEGFEKSFARTLVAASIDPRRYRGLPVETTSILEAHLMAIGLWPTPQGSD
jgi:glycosyltransferase involved in cell wall biosynthesis